jgi:CMP-N,N'-diacetyllegionaminic acid synthase
MKQILTIIPARGGSKGIKNKNIQKINRYSLIEYAIRSSLNVKFNNEIVVSTDCPKIKNISVGYRNIHIINRPKSLSTDTASSESAVLHALKKFKIKKNYYPDITIMRQCTSPFIFSNELNDALNYFIKNNFDSLFSAKEYDHFLWDKNVNPINHDSSKRLPRQQIKSNYFEEDGAFYIFKTIEFLKIKNRFFGKVGKFVTPKYKSIDIDEIHDLEYARILSKKREIQDEFN